MSDDQVADYQASDRHKAQMAHYTIRRTGLPEEIAGTALLLCSDASSWITGQVYPVEGGYSSDL